MILLHSHKPLIIFGSGNNGKSSFLQSLKKEIDEISLITEDDAKKFPYGEEFKKNLTIE